jgi:hypothetical protein
MLRLDMSSSDGENNLGPVANEPFARSISWRVFNEHFFPKHSASADVIAARVGTGRVSYVIPEHETLTLTAVISGRERFEDVAVTHAVLDAVTPSKTYETKPSRYVWRLTLWGVLWVAAFALIWPALGVMAIFAFVVLFAALCVVPPFLSRALVDFIWWSGHGFRSGARVRWILATVLWLLDLIPLVFLQIRVG